MRREQRALQVWREPRALKDPRVRKGHRERKGPRAPRELPDRRGLP